MPLKFAVVGCGRMGRRRLDSLRSRPGALVSACDAAPDTARDIEKEYGIPCRSDYRAAIEDADVAVVCAPNHLHAPIALEALRRGRHVFCEKPLASDPVRAREMLDASLACGKTLAVGSNLRYFPNVSQALKLFHEGAVGEPLFARAWIGHNGWNLAKPWHVAPALAGGGALLDNGAHALDLLRLFLGEMADCSGMTDSSLDGRPVEDNAMGVFRSLQGRLGFVHASWTEWAGYFDMEVYGTKGFLRIDCRGGACALETGPRDGGRTTRWDFSQSPKNSCQDEFAAYCRALEQGRPPPAGGYDGLRAVQMAFGIYDSARTGDRVGLWTEADQELRRRIDLWENSSALSGSTTT